jgi:dolichyl-phosphooligosaccharide-protein glycotransferase
MNKRLIPFIAFAAVLAINLYFRSLPAYFPQLKKIATAAVLNAKLGEFSDRVRQRFPGIPASAQYRIARAQNEQYQQTNAKDLQRQIGEEYLKQKDRFQDKRGQTYLMELDCWHWARYVANVVRSGHPGDKVVNGKQFDMLMNAPDGCEMSWNHFLFYFSAWLYKPFQFFFSVPLESFLFYLPLLFMSVFLALLFFFCLRFYGLICAFVSCLIVGMAPIFLPRSVAGWFDMDILAMLMPLLMVCCYLLSSEKTGKKKFFWIAAAAFWTGLFAFTWIYWFVFAGIIVIYEVYSLVNLASERLQYRTPVAAEVRSRLSALALYGVCSIFFVLIFAGVEPFRALYAQIRGALLLNDATISVWPNVLATVGELKRPDFLVITSATGDSLLFCLGLASMISLLLFIPKFRGIRRESIVMFTVWFIAMFLVSFKGVRFVMFLLIPLGILLGWGLEEAFAIAEERKNWAVFGACTMSLAYMCFSCVNFGYKAADGVFPLMDDRWYSLLTTIRQETPPGSVINSWWDFGDWFKTAGARAVIFDGQSQDGPRAYWMARALLTADENEAVNILRMLNNGGNRVFDILDRSFGDPFRSLAVTRELVVSSRDGARQKLAGVVPVADAQKVEALIFDPPANKGYFIVDSSMLLKMPAISFIGNWDAVKVYVAENLKRRGPEEIKRYLSRLGISAAGADELMMEAAVTRHEQAAWISSIDYFYGAFKSTKTEDGLVFFDNGSVYNPSSRKLYLYDSVPRVFGTPQSVMVYDANNTAAPDAGSPDSGISTTAVIRMEGDGYQMLLFSPELAKSIFFRLQFLRGSGCSHFKPFAEEKNLASVYEIVW